MKLAGNYRLMLIKYMFEDMDFFLKCVSYLEPSYFSEEDQRDQYLLWIFINIKNYYEKYNERCSFEYLGQKVRQLEDIKQLNYLNVLLKVKEIKVTDKKFLKDELTMFIKTSEFKKMHMKVADLFNENRYEDAFSYTEDSMNKINEVKFSEDDYIKVDEIDSILIDARNSYEEEIDIMGKEFKYDEERYWSGKIPKQSVTTVVAGYNVGKTSFSIGCAYHAAKSSKKVLFIFHEGRKQAIVLKFLSRITKIPYNRIKSGDYLDDNEDIQKIEEAKKFIDLNIRIKEMRTVGVTVDDVYKYCKNTKREWNFDLLVDDYGQKLWPKKRMSEMRHNTSDVWNTFDLMSAELDIAILTCAQLNRENAIKNKAGDEIIRSSGVSEAISIAFISETILTLNKSSKQEGLDEMIVCLDKARDCVAGMLIKCRTDMKCSLTHDVKRGMEVYGYDGIDNGDE